MEQFYEMKVAGLTRQLPLCKVSDELYIGAFVIFGDVELTVNSARELLKVAPEHDIMITAESKGIPLVYEMARQSGENKYLIARKAPKLYPPSCYHSPRTITTCLPLEKGEVDCRQGANCCFVAFCLRYPCLF